MSVEVLNESGTEVDVVELTKLSRFVMQRMRLHPATEMCLRLVDEDTIATLNRHWMGQDGPTDVLSFPMDELEPGRDGEDPPEGYLGDIALCPAVAGRQADQAGHDAIDEIRLLTTHGLLHLLGYDHAEPEAHRVMFALQARLLAEWHGVSGGDELLDAGVVAPADARPGVLP
ncbi:MAG: rRNA maturation RNase YbeY [Nocardioidaceae bacterium]|jgi:probable rRNA maturation factor|nr:rRNA maturation RNase YbeY [Nocardioidaceae bacterium]